MSELELPTNLKLRDTLLRQCNGDPRAAAHRWAKIKTECGSAHQPLQPDHPELKRLLEQAAPGNLRKRLLKRAQGDAEKADELFAQLCDQIAH